MATRLYGVDGCKGGWLAACAPDLETAPAFTVYERFDDLVRAVVRTHGLACVDVPIGLADAPRRCDVEARRVLGGARACCVFTPPSRTALAARTVAEARRLNLAATGRSLSAQTVGIVPKIHEVDGCMTPRLQRRIREVHPEVVFAAASSAGIGLAEAKKTDAGRRRRLRLLPPAYARAVEACAFPRRVAAVDDAIDALAALVVAARWRAGEVRRLPAGAAQRDERGLAMEIVF